MRALILSFGILSSCEPAAQSARPDPVIVAAPPMDESAAPPGSVGSAAPTVSAPPVDLRPAPGPGQGSYVSASCTGRSYERIVTLGPNSDVGMIDRVSPCPKGARCVWSGIVIRRGTYSVEAPSALGKPFRVVLALDDADNPKASPAPAHLLWWESRGVLTEPDQSCSYRRPL